MCAHAHTHTNNLSISFLPFVGKKDYKQLVTCSNLTNSFSKQRSGGSCTELQLFRWLLIMVIFVFFHHSLFAWRFGVPGTKNKIIKGSETEVK